MLAAGEPSGRLPWRGASAMDAALRAATEAFTRFGKWMRMTGWGRAGALNEVNDRRGLHSRS
jgi:hypothetical protein